METAQMIEKLNQMLSQEHACTIRYATHAALVTGPCMEPIRARLKEISGDESSHAEKLRDRITALGGTPTMRVSEGDLKQAALLSDILKVNIAEEWVAIQSYSEILKDIPPSNAILFLTIQDILREEQEHFEELKNLEQKK